MHVRCPHNKIIIKPNAGRSEATTSTLVLTHDGGSGGMFPGFEVVGVVRCGGRRMRSGHAHCVGAHFFRYLCWKIGFSCVANAKIRQRRSNWANQRRLGVLSYQRRRTNSGGYARNAMEWGGNGNHVTTDHVRSKHFDFDRLTCSPFSPATANLQIRKKNRTQAGGRYLIKPTNHP